MKGFRGIPLVELKVKGNEILARKNGRMVARGQELKLFAVIEEEESQLAHKGEEGIEVFSRGVKFRVIIEKG